jgi:hypothetical protein
MPALVRTDVSEDLSASIIRATRIGELATLSNVPKTAFFIATSVKTLNLIIVCKIWRFSRR